MFDKDMWDLVDSVKKFGVLEPVVVIPSKEGGYEMVSGHRRQRACQLAGIQTMPVIVRQLDRDEATISMVDANLKRENISPMEMLMCDKVTRRNFIDSSPLFRIFFKIFLKALACDVT